MGAAGGVVVAVVAAGAGAAATVAVFAVRRWAARVTEAVAAVPPAAPASADPAVTAAAHRLRRAQVALGTAGLAAALAGAGTVGSGLDGSRVLAVGAVAAAAAVGSRLAIALGTAPALAALRGSVRAAPGRWQRRALGAGGLAALAGVLVAGEALAPRHGAGHLLGLLAAYVAALGAVNGPGAPLLARAAGARPLDGPTRARLMALNAALRGGVRDIRSYPGRPQRSANAVQVGVFPGLRYVLVSDYLLDHMTPAEVDAVVGHELGHAREHHLAWKLLATAACWGSLLAAAGEVATPSAAWAGVVGAALPVGYLAASVLVQGGLGVHLERRADAVAARDVGAGPLADALDRLAALNHTPARTGRAWALLTQHPGIAGRVEVLRAAQAGALRP